MKKLIGYGYTNSSGVATLDYDTDDDEIDGYTGTGAGLMNFRAEMHDDSTVVSPPYEVTDCTFYDKGLTGTGNHNDDWVNNSNYFEIIRGTEYTTLKPTYNGTTNRLTVKSENIPSSNYIVEFNKPVFTGTASQVIFVINSRAVYYSHYDLVNATHCKFQVNTDGSIYVWINGERQTDTSYTVTGSQSIRFQVQDNVEANSIKFSEFKIYPV